MAETAKQRRERLQEEKKNNWMQKAARNQKKKGDGKNGGGGQPPIEPAKKTEKNEKAEKAEKKIKSFAKAAGLKSTFILSSEELLMTKFGNGNEAIREKRVKKDVISPIASGEDTLFVEREGKNFKVDSTVLREQMTDNKLGSVSDPLQSTKSLGENQIGTKSALEQRYFGHTFEDNIHIQIAHSILDIEKILAVHINNIIYSINNLARRDDPEKDDFLGNGEIGLRNTFEEYQDPTTKELPEKKRAEIRNSYKCFCKYLSEGRLSYYGIAFYTGKSSEEKYANGIAIYDKATREEKLRYLVRELDDVNVDMLNGSDYQYCFDPDRYNDYEKIKEKKSFVSKIQKLANPFKPRLEREIYYILAILDAVRQFCMHDGENNRYFPYQLDSLLDADAKTILDKLYSEKIKELNNFLSTSGKSNLGLLFEALNAETDEQKFKITADFYQSTVRKAYKNIGFSVKVLRETIVEQYLSEIKDKKYDSIRSKMYQLFDFLIWNYYSKDADANRNLTKKLRTKVKNDQKAAVYRETAEEVWEKLSQQFTSIANNLKAVGTKHKSSDDKDIIEGSLSRFSLFNFKKDDGSFDKEKSKAEREKFEAALKSAVDDNDNRIVLSEDVSSFSKLIYLLTLFLDGKEINDLLTTLINAFDDISSFYQVLDDEKNPGIEPENRETPQIFADNYRFFDSCRSISRELRDINSFARMTKATECSRDVMFHDAAELLGTDDSAENLDKYLEETTLNRIKFKTKEGTSKADTGFRNFMDSNVIKSARFRYVVRYANAKKLREIMNNASVVDYVLSELPREMLNGYCRDFGVNDCQSDKGKRKEIAQKLAQLRFNQFENVCQSANVADLLCQDDFSGDESDAIKKNRDQKLIFLYLYVAYQLVKNMIYINSRYFLAFHCLERDMELRGERNSGSEEDNKERPYAALTLRTLESGQYNRYYRENVKENYKVDGKKVTEKPDLSALVRTNGSPLAEPDKKERNEDYNRYMKSIEENKRCLNKVGRYLLDNYLHSDQSTINVYRNKVAHLNAVRNMSLYIADFKDETLRGKTNKGFIPNYYFGLYHYIMQRELMSNFGYENGSFAGKTKIGGKTKAYFAFVEKSGIYSKDFVKALNIPFAYNFPRYKNLSIDGLFDRNREGNKKETIALDTYLNIEKEQEAE